MTSPVPYRPDVEHTTPDEAEAIAAIRASMRKIVQRTFDDGRHGLRSVHAKSHGLLEGTLTVLDSLPSEYAQGLFATPGQYPVVMRISTNPGDVLPDSVSTPRGLAVKIIGVDGERLHGSDIDRTQDFVLVNGPAFIAATPKAFAASLKLLASTTDAAETLKKGFSAVARGVEHVLEAVGTKSPTLVSLGGQPATHPLGETFYSQAPIRYGDYVAKVSIAPVSSELVALTGTPVVVNGRPDALREEIATVFAAHGGTWELRVQLCTDLDAMPVEDASVPWPEDASPYVPVARIAVDPQSAWSEARPPRSMTDCRSRPGTVSRRTSRSAGSCGPANRSMPISPTCGPTSTVARCMSRASASRCRAEAHAVIRAMASVKRRRASSRAR